MTVIFKMTHGTTHHHWSGKHRRRDQIHVQKKHNMWNYWTRRSCSEYYSPLSKKCRNQDIIYAVVPFFNSMERSLPKRGITRRKYEICLLETRYPCQDRTNFAKPTKPTKRKYEDGRCFETRSVCRNKQTADESCTIDAIKSKTKRLCLRDRPVVNDTLRDKVFQGVGSDLIAPWLTPMELYNVKLSFKCDWDWGQSWYGGNVRNRATASKIAVHVHLGTHVDALIDMFGKDTVFSALWYILSCKEFVFHAHRLKHYKSIRKLDRLT